MIETSLYNPDDNGFAFVNGRLPTNAWGLAAKERNDDERAHTTIIWKR
jgi:hypothetical protein